MSTKLTVNWEQLNEFSGRIEAALSPDHTLSSRNWKMFLSEMESMDTGTQRLAAEHLMLFSPAET